MSTNVPETIGNTADTPSSAVNGKNISSAIRTEINRNSILNSARFAVSISAPKIFNSGRADTNEILLMCTNRGTSASLPGIQLNTSSIRRYGVGLEERKPVSSIVVDQQFTFIADRSNRIHDFFYHWINSIVVGNKFQATDTTNSRRVDPFRAPGSVLYKDSYRTDIDIFLYDEGGNTVYAVRLHNAFPVALGDVQLSWGSSSDFVQLPVTFTYTHWTSQLIGDVTSLSAKSGGKSILQNIQRGVSAALLLSTLKKPTNIQDILSVVNNAKTVIGGFNLTFGR